MRTAIINKSIKDVLDFRIWDTQENRFRLLDDPQMCDAFCIMILNHGDDSSEAGRYVAQKFTGLLDRNGTKIYEGDILEVVQNSKSMGDSQWNMQVLYSDSDAAFGLLYIAEQGDLIPICQWSFCTFKVIGNIHENPELLKA